MKRLAIILTAAALLVSGCTGSEPKPGDDVAGAVVDVAVPGQPNPITHGNDPLPPKPPGLVAQAVPEAPWPCEGNGTDGRRAQLLYLYPAGGQSNFASLRPTFEAWARQIEGMLLASARRSGGERLLRFVTGPGCTLSIVERAVSANALGSFDAMISELRSAGFSASNRIYHAWVESSSYCGIGTVYRDDRPHGNFNESNAQYSRSDRPCWTPQVALHEIIHNLGGVQNSAPNSTGGLHTRDEHDVMSYPDGAPNGQMITVCADPVGEDRLDCRHDDYFNASPSQDPSSYLSTHWDVARASALVTSAPTTTLPPAPTTTTTSTTLPPAPTTTVGKGPTVTELEVPSTVRQGVPFQARARVTGECGPTGTVAFYVSGKLMSRQVLDRGDASVTITIVNSARRPTLRADYTGSPACATSRDTVRPRVS